MCGLQHNGNYNTHCVLITNYLVNNRKGLFLVTRKIPLSPQSISLSCSYFVFPCKMVPSITLPTFVLLEEDSVFSALYLFVLFITHCHVYSKIHMHTLLFSFRIL